MKRILYFFLFGILASVNYVFSQSTSCSTATPICSGSGVTYPAAVDNGSAPTGPNYGCLATRPNPSYFTLTVGTTGTININISNSQNRDIDWIVWGPFDSTNAALNVCGTLGNPSSPANSNVVNCNYSASGSGTISISGTAGKVYVLMVTNFSNLSTNISITQSGTGSLCCPSTVTMPRTNMCVNQTMNLSPGTGGTWTSSNTAVATVTNAGLVTAVSAGSVFFTFTNTSGCNSSTGNLTVNALPVLSNPTPSCIEGGSTANITPSTGGTWTSSNTGVATITNGGIITGVGAGTTTLTYTNTTTGCSATRVITVNPALKGGTIQSAQDVTACVGYRTSITASDATLGCPVYSYLWEVSSNNGTTYSPAGSTTLNITPSFPTAGTFIYRLKYTDSNGIIAYSDTKKITINPDPISQTIVPSPNSTTVCAGTDVSATFTGGSGGAGTVVDVYEYSTNTGTSWQAYSPGTAISTAGLSGTDIVQIRTRRTATASLGCNNGAFVIYKWSVNPLPTITGTSAVCVGSSITLTGSGTPATSSAWTSSNTSIATVDTTGKVTGVSGGTATITYTNNNGCSKTFDVTINALPTISGNNSVCLNASTTLTGSGTPNATNPWVSSNTSVATIDSTGKVTGITVGTANITFTDVNGCSNTFSITVNGLPSISGNTTVCVNSKITLIGSGSPNANNPWVSSDASIASISPSGEITGISPGTAVITYADINGCTATYSVEVKNCITAVDDSFGIDPGTTGSTSVLHNDNFNGISPLNTTDYTITQLTTSNAGVQLNPATGLISVVLGVPNNIYYITYKVCANAFPTLCSEATVKITVPALSYCYETATAGTGEDSKHGITSLSRAGKSATPNASATQPDNWPMVRKGAHTVLESKTKGFVLTRLSQSQIASIANPVEGMMVYNTDAKCLKIYTGESIGTPTGWLCYKLQTCPNN